MDYEQIRYEVDGPILTLTLNRPEKLNAFTVRMMHEMIDAFAVTGRWVELPKIVLARYGDLLDRVSYYLPFEPGVNDTGWRNTIDRFKRLAGG